MLGRCLVCLRPHSLPKWGLPRESLRRLILRRSPTSNGGALGNQRLHASSATRCFSITAFSPLLLFTLAQRVMLSTSTASALKMIPNERAGGYSGIPLQLHVGRAWLAVVQRGRSLAGT